MSKNEGRFIESIKCGNGLTGSQKVVIVDKETGVNYLWVHEGYAGGLTVLVDAEGKPVVTPVKSE